MMLGTEVPNMCGWTREVFMDDAQDCGGRRRKRRCTYRSAIHSKNWYCQPQTQLGSSARIRRTPAMPARRCQERAPTSSICLEAQFRLTRVSTIGKCQPKPNLPLCLKLSFKPTSVDTCVLDTCVLEPTRNDSDTHALECRML
jgi:hypothetical protein